MTIEMFKTALVDMGVSTEAELLARIREWRNLEARAADWSQRISLALGVGGDVPVLSVDDIVTEIQALRHDRDALYALRASLVIESLPADFVPESMAVYAIYRAVREELTAARLTMQEVQNSSLAAYGVFDRKAGAADSAVVDAQRRLRTAYDRACWFAEHKDVLNKSENWYDPPHNYDPFAQPVAPHKHRSDLTSTCVYCGLTSTCVYCGEQWPCSSEREYRQGMKEVL